MPDSYRQRQDKDARRKRLRMKDKDILELIETRRDECFKARRKDTGQWYQALAFYHGDQWVGWNPRAEELQDLVSRKRETDPRRVRVTVSKIMPAVRQLAGLIVSRRHTLQALPAQPDESDRDAARASTEILQWYFSDPEINLSGILYETVIWGLVCGGGGFIKAVWNPDLQYYKYKGDLEFEFVPPFRLYWDVSKSDLQKSAWFIEEMLLDKDDCNRRWPDKEDVIECDGHMARDSVKGQFPFAAQGMAETPFGTQLPQLDDKVTVKLQFERPSKAYPDGRVTFATALGVLDRKPMKSLYDCYPYFRFRYLPKLNTGVSGLSPTEQAIEPQMLLNRLMSQMTENNNALLYYFWLIARESNVNIEEITNTTGQAIYYDASGGVPAPSIMSAPPIAHQIWAQMADLKLSIDDIYALHEPMRGQATGRVESGKAIEALQEQDISSQTPAINAYENMLVRLGQHVLHIARKKWSQKRIIHVIGETKAWEARAYGRADIGDNTVVRLEPQSDLPNTPSARRDYMREMAQYKIPEMMQLSPWFRGFFFRNLETGASGREFFHEQRQHENKAKEESERILSGDPSVVIQAPPELGGQVACFLMPSPFDDHSVHYQQHVRDFLSPAYEEASKPAQQALWIHALGHQAMQAPPQQMATLLQGAGLQQGLLRQHMRGGPGTNPEISGVGAAMGPTPAMSPAGGESAPPAGVTAMGAPVAPTNPFLGV